MLSVSAEVIVVVGLVAARKVASGFRSPTKRDSSSRVLTEPSSSEKMFLLCRELRLEWSSDPEGGEEARSSLEPWRVLLFETETVSLGVR